MSKWIFILILLAGPIYAGPCIKPDLGPLFEKLRGVTRIHEAIELRRDFLNQNQFCDMDDFAKLTDLENESPNGEFFRAYKLRLADFVLEEIHPFAGAERLQDYQQIFTSNLVPKMKTLNQKLELRLILLASVRSCLDLILLTESWEYEPSGELLRGLRTIKRQNEDRFCRR